MPFCAVALIQIVLLPVLVKGMLVFVKFAEYPLLILVVDQTIVAAVSLDAAVIGTGTLPLFGRTMFPHV